MEFLTLQDGEAAVAEKLPELLPITTALLVDTSHEAKGEGWCGYGAFDWRHLCLKMELCMPVFPGNLEATWVHLRYVKVLDFASHSILNSLCFCVPLPSADAAGEGARCGNRSGGCAHVPFGQL